MIDEADTARSRAALARVQTLRLERRTQEAQALEAAVRAGQLPGVRFGRVAESDTAATVLGEHAVLERALLLLRQDDDERYRDALKILQAARERLLPPGSASAPALTGDRQRRMVSKLSVAYSQAGREEDANELVAWILGLESADFAVWHAWQPDDWRRQVAKAADIRAADQLGNVSVRASRVALVDILANTHASRLNAKRWLDIAQRTAQISLDKRHTRHGIGISQRALFTVELHRARLRTVSEGRQEVLRSLAGRLWAFVVESHDVPENGRAVLISRHAMYGQVLVELARCARGEIRQRQARLARVAMRPMAAFHELDSSYDTDVGLFYGDACAMSGDVARASRAWQRSLTRLLRARPTRVDAAAAVNARLTGAQAR